MPLSQQDIDDNKTVSSCTRCGGSGTLLVPSDKGIPTKNPNRVVHFTKAVLCVCRKNELVELSNPFFNKTPLITEETAAEWAKQFDITKNLHIIWPESEKDIMPYLKGVLVHYRQDTNKTFHISNGLNIIQEYYVAQPDGITRTLNDLVLYKDLLVIIFNTQAVNKAVTPVMMELIQARFNANKPTWVCSSAEIHNSAEFSEDLRPILDKFIAFKPGKPGAKKARAHANSRANELGRSTT